MFLSADAQALLAAQAFVEDAAIAACGRRHLRVDDQPLVVVPLGLAGEDGAPLAFGVGRSLDDLELIVVPEPRDRDEVDRALARFAERICDWIEPIASHRVPRSVGRWRAAPVASMPAQLVVPTPAGMKLLRTIAQRMVWGKNPPTVKRAGGWLHFFCDRHEVVPADSTLIIATEAASLHWVLPLSGAESGHLLAVRAALGAPPGEATNAAREAEARPGGTLTTPALDAELLSPAIARYGKARKAKDDAARAKAEEQVAAVVAPVVRELYDACHDILDRLRELPPIPPLYERRCEQERVALTRHADFLDAAPRFARADSLRRSLYLVDDAEQELRRVREEARTYDPILRAVAASTGEALDGIVASCSKQMVKLTVKRAGRLDVVLHAPGVWRPAHGVTLAIVWEGTAATFEVVDATADGDGTRVHLRSSGGHRAALANILPSVGVGDALAFVVPADSYTPPGLPSQTPWMFAARSDDA